jgi:hypothetical protein
MASVHQEAAVLLTTVLAAQPGAPTPTQEATAAVIVVQGFLQVPRASRITTSQHGETNRDRLQVVIAPTPEEPPPGTTTHEAHIASQRRAILRRPGILHPEAQVRGAAADQVQVRRGHVHQEAAAINRVTLTYAVR